MRLNMKQSAQKEKLQTLDYYSFRGNYFRKTFYKKYLSVLQYQLFHFLFEIAATLARFCYVRMTHLFLTGKPDISKRLVAHGGIKFHFDS